ncbi:Cupredoxin [Polychytrium aggregatum]|uniref:Cupredoxin n=1 Tax=Polychytrium aggregatum TaxID=110093 RepID=UPI0022FE7CF6|nr:Cupredoxin [Polychytrium aggregatum]KAI9204098.1 Cupredoxin [Polychytrium aggregatum]
MARALFSLLSFLLAVLPLCYAATKTFTLNLAYSTVAPDGFSGRMMLANGQIDYPISVNKGDDVEITVVNNLDVATTIHWHGIFQKGTPFMDGAGGVTQCPIQPGATFVYKFNVGDQTGTYWWHAHYKSQYVDGLRGPFIINDPSDPYKSQYDTDLTVTLSDFHHKPSQELLNYYFTPNEGAFEPVPDSGLIGGAGRFNCSFAPAGSTCKDSNPLTVYNVVPGKRYRLRLINTSAMAKFNFTIDGHNMTIIEADGVYTNPTVVNILPIHTGQRYSVIVTANAPTAIGNFWMRADINNLWDPAPWLAGGLNPQVRAIWRYQNAPVVDPTTQIATDLGFDVYSLGELNGIAVGNNPSWNSSIYLDFFIGPLGDQNITTATTTLSGPPDWTSVQYLMPSVPSLYTAQQNQALPNSSAPIPVDDGSWVYIEIHNDDAMEHVFHLHGHTFYVVSHGRLLHAPTATATLARRDSIQVPSCVGGHGGTGEQGCLKGFLGILVNFNNPGTWLMHCHMEWHMAAGLVVTFVNNAGLSSVDFPSGFYDQCNAPTKKTKTKKTKATKKHRSAAVAA